VGGVHLDRLSSRHKTLAYIALPHSRMFSTLPDNAICLFLLNIREGSGGLVHWNVLSLSRTGTVPLTGIVETVASEASQVAYH
jgi:hypothetical protein